MPAYASTNIEVVSADGARRPLRRKRHPIGSPTDREAATLPQHDGSGDSVDLHADGAWRWRATEGHQATDGDARAGAAVPGPLPDAAAPVGGRERLPPCPGRNRAGEGGRPR